MPQTQEDSRIVYFDPNDIDWLIPDEFICQKCGFPVDSTNHEIGCETKNDTLLRTK